MDTEKNMVTVPLERYEQLIATEARIRVLTIFTQKEVVYISREVVAKILGIDLDAGAASTPPTEE